MHTTPAVPKYATWGERRRQTPTEGVTVGEVALLLRGIRRVVGAGVMFDDAVAMSGPRMFSVAIWFQSFWCHLVCFGLQGSVSLGVVEVIFARQHYIFQMTRRSVRNP